MNTMWKPTLLLVCGLLSNGLVVDAIEQYLADIPNGDQFGEALAHTSGYGFNVFGSDYSEDPSWEALCPKDSDGDGFTNGQELNDPDCTGKPKGKALSDPSKKESVPEDTEAPEADEKADEKADKEGGEGAGEGAGEEAEDAEMTPEAGTPEEDCDENNPSEGYKSEEAPMPEPAPAPEPQDELEGCEEESAPEPEQLDELEGCDEEPTPEPENDLVGCDEEPMDEPAPEADDAYGEEQEPMAEPAPAPQADEAYGGEETEPMAEPAPEPVESYGEKALEEPAPEAYGEEPMPAPEPEAYGEEPLPMPEPEPELEPGLEEEPVFEGEDVKSVGPKCRIRRVRRARRRLRRVD